jgi:PPK2 family polyphosphate:nucleotide phosphotransferase
MTKDDLKAEEAIARPEEYPANGGGEPDPDYPRYRVEPGKHIRLADIDPNESEHYRSKDDVKGELERQRKRIADLQERLYAECKQSLLIVLQAIDTGGKDGTIRSVFEGVNPQGCQVWSFKVPSLEESLHDFLWRYHQKAPARGMVVIFNRSHYEEVLVVRVKNLSPKEVWSGHYEVINNFERMLARNHTAIIKFFLYISKDEQKHRFESRLKNPEKRWKFRSSDLEDRALWDDYMQAFEDAVNKCSTEYAPWYVVPANKKWYRNLVVARAIADTLEAMNPQFPEGENGLDKVVIPE